ncbi:5-oxopent-3-ene-1,2,5-tricarboxylate decarboxylase [Paraburkholderia ginsengiterrae]|uniref:5-oxopent-3-ene-1,2,5-tricarboxylate decarboxylase n=1 Tax=Paraburkholderia ginsengiterrae TaxID=1462993 RepID=A0A1A9NA61_9BURK|nr:fumarylacetoacetate hydrolase family protein [Paraburkholderia ginsengiterrae]OAJ61430.1 5-oxopent-3-ene-1,2,5-tricarboxylate decarboxylase [Paraburkholderia ginsengiterrae]OAJ62833.1 5-oxopent-3-ene-1,2,5-tricarboxylate decarboxylase [Paraburkholderia ginsengiterrae]
MTWFGIATYELNGRRAAGLAVGDRLYDAQAALKRVAGDAPLADLGALIAGWATHGAAAVDQFERAARAIEAGTFDLAPLEGHRLCVPFQPRRIFAAASNYYEHAREMGTELAPREESTPYMFIKAETSVVPTLANVVIPPHAERVDWEVELAVVIGRQGRHIAQRDAYDYVAGYTILNDVSARDLNRRTDYPFKHDWFRGKSFDTFGPLGPWFVPRACIAEPQNLRMRLAVNGEMMQDGNTSEMIFNIAEQIEYLSTILTLQPGDLIATGTPTGVGMGRGIYLKAGDVMVASIDGIGTIENPLVAG